MIAPESMRSNVLPALGRFVALLAIAMVLGRLLQASASWRILIAIMIAVFLVALIAYRPSVGYASVLVFAAVMGGLRHWLIPLTGWPRTDALLVVVPCVVFLQLLRVAGGRALPFNTPVSRLMLPLVLIMVLEIFNPLQGGILVGLEGAMFFLGSIMWFYVARFFADRGVLERALWTVAMVATAAAFYGLIQTWFGFLPSEETWIKLGGYQSLTIMGVVRAFSFFSSASEYARFLGIGVVILWAYVLRGRWSAALPLPVLMIAIFVESSRAVMALTITACAILWAIQSPSTKGWLVRGLLALGIALMGLYWSAAELQNATLDSRVSPLVQHQASGLLSPLGQKSTLSTHVSMVTTGLVSGIVHPFGEGLGATLPSTGGGPSLATEQDESDMIVSLGLVGGLLYICVYGAVFFLGFTLWHRTRSTTVLAALGVLLAEMNHWLTAGEYSTVVVVWFCVGALDAMRSAEKSRQSPRKRVRKGHSHESDPEGVEDEAVDLVDGSAENGIHNGGPAVASETKLPGPENQA